MTTTTYCCSTSWSPKGKMRPVIDRVYPLQEMAAVHRCVDQGHKQGNVVITVAHKD